MALNSLAANIQKSIRNNPYPYLIALAFLVWMFCFRKFLLNQNSLVEDALAYFDHYKFFIEQIRQGIYPMWDPYMIQGYPTEFFMRRIGSFNPFNFLILFYNLIGFPYTTAYLLFLASYFFVGMVGYYLAAKECFNDQLTAFIAYLFLLFSTLGTRLFDSYFLLIFIPLPWFFYFLIKFVKSQQKSALVGLTLTVMIFLTTYVPFYFLTIVLVFLIVLVLFYLKEFLNAVRSMALFFNKNRLLSVLCVGAVLLALIPGYLFYKDGKSGEIVLPARSASVQEGDNAIKVGYNTSQHWAIEEDLAFSAYFSYKDMKFAILYVPVFVYLVFLLGLFLNIEKRSIFIFCWGLVLYLICTPNAPVYKFLYDHVFFFKYFRNIHFFLWIVLLPIAMLFIARQLANFFNIGSLTRKQNLVLCWYVLVLHLVVLILMHVTGGFIVSTYISLILSAALFVLYFLNKMSLKSHLWVMLFGILLIVVIPPLEVFTYLSQNSPLKKGPYNYESKQYVYYLPTMEEKMLTLESQKDIVAKSIVIEVQERPNNLYYGTTWNYFLKRYFDANIFEKYLRSGFLLYDSVERAGNSQLDLNKIAQSFYENRNVAFVDQAYPKERENNGVEAQSSFFEVLAKGSSGFEVVSSNVNSIKLKLNLKDSKFLVYNSNFHSQWEAFLNSKKVPLYRANVSFLGLWIPAGENIIEFRFGLAWRYALNWGLLGLFQVVFIGLLVHLFNERKSILKNNGS